MTERIIQIMTREELARYPPAIIDYMRKQLKLQPEECYVVIKILFEEFPKEYIPKKIKGLKTYECDTCKMRLKNKEACLQHNNKHHSLKVNFNQIIS